eukprot:CAMPEP_0172443606 /NCGR_PEP_ID=MMETSP1065-20121228/3844_1 /TAXON_ID=265537 /ORGANISM="Amphiprora paludosa, Strain CCMP125" /LENGTH=131 /DNA_ID=CAMNT_0013193897 /DNA_START=46 /DNA_END=441 /DNA_ORIENTATION=+
MTKLLSDEDICHRVSALPDRVLLGAFDKPLGQELGKLPLMQKTALRAVWFNPNKWSELVQETKLKFIRFLLDNSKSQHQIADQLRDAVMDIAKTLCGYNAVKGACQAGFHKLTHRNGKENATESNKTSSSK